MTTPRSSLPSFLPINEIFHSLQGEGYFTGTPALFIRLQSCPVGCPWCDTKHTWEKNDDRIIPFDAMLNKTVDADTWSDTPLQTLVDYIVKAKEQLVVITGGEPCLYDLTELTTAVLGMDKRVQIETSGTEDIRANMATWITISPKIAMPGGRKVLMGSLYCADEIKMPVGKPADIVVLLELLKTLDEFAQDRPELIYLQPLSQSPKATQLCIEMAREHGWRLSAQLHKYLEVR